MLRENAALGSDRRYRRRAATRDSQSFMAKKARKTANGSRSAQTAKYDAHHEVMEETYGALADLRRQLADSPELVKRREKTLQEFAECQDAFRSRS